MKRLRLALWLAVGVFTAATIAYQSFAPRSPTLRGIALDEPRQLQDVALTSSVGAPRSFSDWRGRVLLVFFGYTSCPDTCPLTLAKLGRIYRDLGAPEDVQVLMISVDPERDTPERLGQYLGRFDPDFVGLTGTPDAVARAASQFFVASYQDGGLVNHTTTVNLVGPEGKIRAIYKQDQLEMIQEDLKNLLAKASR